MIDPDLPESPATPAQPSGGPTEPAPDDFAPDQGQSGDGEAVDLRPESSASEEVQIDRAAEARDALMDATPIERAAAVVPPAAQEVTADVPRQPPPADAETRLAIDHVPDRTHAYPGEDLTFFTRLRVLDDVKTIQLRIRLPHEVEVLGARGPEAGGVHVTETGPDGIAIRWTLEQGGARQLDAGRVLEFETDVRVPRPQLLGELAPLPDQADLVSSAEAVVAGAGGRARRPAGESAVVAVWAKGAYLKHLPAVYERDSLMSRFLMLFESFWAPIQRQTDSIFDYFDPQLAPLPMVRWLADKLDLSMDEDWPEEAQRRMLQRAVPLYRLRGTRRGLEELLETYTGARAEIIERRANNFRLGSGARLGQGVALGARNQPHTFNVRVKLPVIPEDPRRPGHAERLRERRRERIRALIDVEKPAHVTYTLEIDEPAA